MGRPEAQDSRIARHVIGRHLDGPAVLAQPFQGEAGGKSMVIERATDHAHEGLAFAATDDGLLVGFAEDHGVAPTQMALLGDESMHTVEQVWLAGDPAGHLDATDLRADIEIKEVDTLVVTIVVQGRRLTGT